MSEPERIYAFTADTGSRIWRAVPPPYPGMCQEKEYVRADLFSRLQAEIGRYREALTPFARYMDGGIDLDNHGKPLPGDQGVGWVYLTHDDFRRARAALGGSNDH